MKSFSKWMLLAVALPAAAFALEPPKEACTNIKWNQEFLREYPKAPVACREVTMKDGIKYAMFKGQVSEVRSHVVVVEIANVAGTPISEIGFDVHTGGRITMDGVEKKVEDLRVGDELTFWVREEQFGVSPTLTEKPLRIVSPAAMPH